MKKIDAHSHIGSFGGWAGVALPQRSCWSKWTSTKLKRPFSPAASFRDNDTVAKAFHKYPDKIVPFVWVNPLLDNVPEKLHHYVCDEGFMGIKMQPLFDSFVADDPVVYPVMDFAREHKIPGVYSLRAPALFSALEHCPAGRAIPGCTGNHDPHGSRPWGVHRRLH